MSDIPVCIDISHWQNFPDFEEVAASGVLGVIHKCTEGTSYIDPNREENCSNAIAAGLAVSTYFWIKPGDGRAQAEFYLSVLDPVNHERVVIDYEESGCSLTTLKDAIMAIQDYDPSLRITVYSGHLLKEQLNGKDEFLAENTDLWLAQYTTGDPSWEVATWPQWTLWQYSESGTVPGVDGSLVDLNRYNGTDEEFLEWISVEGEAPPHSHPRPPKLVVDVAVRAPQGVDVNVTVNDKVVDFKKGRIRSWIAGRRGPDIER